jgi:hypothetical protein
MPGEIGEARRSFVHIKLAHNLNGRSFKSSLLPGEMVPERILYGAVFRSIQSPGTYLRNLIIATLWWPKLSSSPPASSSAEQDLGP